MFSIINLYHIQNDFIVYILSTILTYLIIILTHLIILLMTAKIRNSDYTKTLNMKVFSEKYGAFIDGLALSGSAGKYWFILVLTIRSNRNASTFNTYIKNMIAI